MVNPQDPGLRRSARGATVDDSAKGLADAVLGGEEGAGPVPEANRPGHRPEHDQDKPEGADVAASLGVPVVGEEADADADDDDDDEGAGGDRGQ